MSASSFAIETYGGFRKDFLNDLSGLELFDRFWNEHLFLNIYDFWSLRRHGYLVDNYRQRNRFLKKIIRSKVKGDENLPSYKILLRMIVNSNYDFNPRPFLDGDWEVYFERLRNWKLCNEVEFLKIRPWMREPKRHIKIKCDFQLQEKEDFIVISD